MNNVGLRGVSAGGPQDNLLPNSRTPKVEHNTSAIRIIEEAFDGLTGVELDPHYVFWNYILIFIAYNIHKSVNNQIIEYLTTV